MLDIDVSSQSHVHVHTCDKKESHDTWQRPSALAGRVELVDLDHKCSVRGRLHEGGALGDGLVRLSNACVHIKSYINTCVCVRRTGYGAFAEKVVAAVMFENVDKSESIIRNVTVCGNKDPPVDEGHHSNLCH